MKKLIKFLIVIAIICVAVYFPIKMIRDKNREAERVEKIKEDMYVEIVYEDLSGCTTKFQLNNNKKNYEEGCAQYELKVRKGPTSAAEIIGTVTKGEIYKVVEVEETDPVFIWFRIVYQKNYKDPYVEGYVSQPRSSEQYVKAYNITFDYASPTLNFDDDKVEFDSIDDINYEDLRVWDDQPGYEITHQVYIEREPKDGFEGPQYWIKYTITDKKGKTASKIRRVIFKNPPSDSKVLDFSTIRS